MSDRLYKILKFFFKENRFLSKEEIPFSEEDIKDLLSKSFIKSDEFALFFESGPMNGRYDKTVKKYKITANGIDALIEHKREKLRRTISSLIALLTLAVSIATLLLTI